MSARQQFPALVEVDRDEQLDELVRLAADAEIGLTVYTHGEPCASDGACDYPGCDAYAKALIGFTVRSRFSGNVFLVTAVDSKGGYPTVEGDGCWAMLDTVTVVAPPEEEDPRC